MTSNRLGIILLAILTLCLLAFAGYKITGNIIEKRAAEKIAREAHIEFCFKMQNEAFIGIKEQRYVPYSREYEYQLQISINCYARNTGNVVTLGDVETFLATPENPDGTPRIWEDDETGIIGDFVEWCYWNSNKVEEYRNDLARILDKYNRQNTYSPYSTIRDLTPEQINELDKKYESPDYDLVLEW